MSFVINPGTEPLPDATQPDADVNMTVFVADLREADLNVTDVEPVPELDDDGRYGYRIHIGQRPVEVRMPGLPIDQVRYVNSDGQDIWDFPRLYIDGASWIWMFAIRACSQDPGVRPDGDQDQVLDDIADVSVLDAEAHDQP